jgi:hypothetical protein
MNRYLFAAFAMFLAMSAPATAASFLALGRVDSVQYDLGGVSPRILSQAPLGSTAQFDFSFDTATPRTSGGPAGSFFFDIPLSGVFQLGGATLALPRGSVALGTGSPGGSPSSFSIFSNFPLGQQINGMSAIDFRMDLVDSTGLKQMGMNLPTVLNASDFDSRSFRIRFFDFQAGGETAIMFSIDRISAGGVPEPQTWALLLAGFALIGSTLRRANLHEIPV